MMAKRYTKDFKHAMVQLVISGKMTPAEVCRTHHLAKSCLYSWLQQWQQFAAQERAPLQSVTSYCPRPTWTELVEPELEADTQPSTDPRVPLLEARIADLERLCGQLALENALLKQTSTPTQQRFSA
jgi:transposase-like protein